MAEMQSKADRLILTAVVAGLVAAVVEMAFVLPIQAVVLHNSPEAVFQSIAVGASGRAAFTGGWTSALQGVGWHVLVSLGAALVYVIAAARWPVLLRRPVIGGLGLGVLAYGVMIFGVIPLSRIGFTMPAADALTLISFAIHLFAFGLPIALVARAMLSDPRAVALGAG